MSAERTATLFNSWAAAYLVPLDDVIAESMNFSTQDACLAIAIFINAATAMGDLNIGYQDATRPIQIFVTPATSSAVANGTIQITDYYDTTDVILEMASSRQTSLTVDYGTIGQPSDSAETN